jgi:hypothetical protein
MAIAMLVVVIVTPLPIGATPEHLSCTNLARADICAGQRVPPAGIEPATYRLEGGCSVR